MACTCMHVYIHIYIYICVCSTSIYIHTYLYSIHVFATCTNLDICSIHRHIDIDMICMAVSQPECMQRQATKAAQPGHAEAGPQAQAPGLSRTGGRRLSGRGFRDDTRHEAGLEVILVRTTWLLL